MKTDRELLELAAKAAGLKINTSMQAQRDVLIDPATAALWIDTTSAAWDPLNDDAHALRLAVKVLNWPHGGRAFDNQVSAMYAVGKLPVDPHEATRRAIVMAAVEIGARRAAQPADRAAVQSST